MQFEKNKPLAPFCTYRIGGPADFFFEAKSVEDLLEAVQWAEANGVRFFVFGGGSNLLFDDAGFRGLVVKVSADRLEVLAGDGEILADSGVKISALVTAAHAAGLTGLEAWNGLPGTVGGAVYGNAGCFGTETKDILKEVELWVPGEGLVLREPDEMAFSYRDSQLKRETAVVLRARFLLQRGNPEEIKKKMMEVAIARVKKQPPGLSTGSFFKNPAGYSGAEGNAADPRTASAGWLIDQCGLKGHRLGNVEISKDHANFFMNKGGATAKEILQMADLAKKAVLEKFGVELEQEVIFVPETGFLGSR